MKEEMIEELKERIMNYPDSIVEVVRRRHSEEISTEKIITEIWNFRFIRRMGSERSGFRKTRKTRHGSAPKIYAKLLD